MLEGRGDIERIYRVWFTAFADFSFAVEDLIIEGDRVALLGAATGRHSGEFFGMPSTGRRIDVACGFFYRFEEKPDRHERRILDFTGLLVQVGVLRAKPAGGDRGERSKLRNHACDPLAPPPRRFADAPPCPSSPTRRLYRRPAPRVLGQPLERLRIGNPFMVRTFEPGPGRPAGRRVVRLDRLGKRIVFGFEADLFVVVHLMIAGRLHWRDRGAAIPGKIGLAAFDFPTGTLLLTEAGLEAPGVDAPRPRAQAALAAFDPGGPRGAGRRPGGSSPRG